MVAAVPHICILTNCDKQQQTSNSKCLSRKEKKGTLLHYCKNKH